MDNYSKKMRISNQIRTTNHELGVYCRNYVEFQSNSDFLKQTIPCFKLFELQLIIMQIPYIKEEHCQQGSAMCFEGPKDAFNNPTI